MDINSEIVSGTSIGGILLGMSIDDIKITLTVNGHYIDDSLYECDSKIFRKLQVDGVISIVAGTDGLVSRLWCKKPYAGAYRSVFHPGMMVRDIVGHSKKQLILHDMLLVDSDYGAGFSIPTQYNGTFYDDIDHVAELPQAMILDELHVMPIDWWR